MISKIMSAVVLTAISALVITSCRKEQNADAMLASINPIDGIPDTL